MVRFCRFRVAAVPMCHPQVIRSRKLMRHDGGNTLKYQDNRERLRTLPLNPMECGNFSFSTAAPLAGIPAISIPCGFTRDALPIGLQIMAKRFDEASIFRAAHAYEQDTPWHTMRPPVGHPERQKGR